MEGTFLDVNLDDCEMELLDGSIWSINPGDLSIVSYWTPTAKVKIESSNRVGFYTYKVTNLSNDSIAYVAKIC